MDKKESFSEKTLLVLEDAAVWNIGRWSSECQALSERQLVALSPLANRHSDAVGWKEKLHLLFMHIQTPPGLEALGRTFDSSQLLEIIHLFKLHANDAAVRQKISFLLVGMTNRTFKDLLIQVKEEELSFLKEEAITEAVQHHLSVLLAELDGNFNQFCKSLSIKENEIKNLDLTSLDSQNIGSLFQAIEKLSKEGNDILQLTSKVLAIAWSAQRIDLIQELGRIKELCQKYLLETLEETQGSPSVAFGIRDLLEKKIQELFSDQDAEGNILPMKESTPALEALVKFSIWNIQDYGEIGLLDSRQILSSSDTSTHAAGLQNRDQLFKEAEKNLAKIGLKTLADLKAAQIYSKQALIEYISAYATL